VRLHLNDTDAQPAVVRSGTPVQEFIPHDRPGEDTNNSGAGPAVQNDFHTLPDDAEGSDQEQDKTYDHDIDQDTAAGMRLDKTMTEFLTTLDPTYISYVDVRGGVTVRSQKA
jgi:hypothetical protein